MPLHLLPKKSWNVYNPQNIARVKADEAAAAAREAAQEQRLEEHDAACRAAILRGEAPPPPPEPLAQDEGQHFNRPRDGAGRDRKHRRLAGEDDTDRDIRLARTATGQRDEDNVAVMKMRNPKIDAPLTDEAGHINLFPVDPKEQPRRERDREAKKEKKKERQSEDSASMRLSNAVGKGGTTQPWYAGSSSHAKKTASTDESFLHFENVDVWGNEDPNRTKREQARIAAADPLVLMKKGQAALQEWKAHQRNVAEEQDRQLKEIKAAQKSERRQHRHHHRSKKNPDNDEVTDRHRSKHGHHHRRRDDRSRSPETSHHRRRRDDRSLSPDASYRRRRRDERSMSPEASHHRRRYERDDREGEYHRRESSWERRHVRQDRSADRHGYRARSRSRDRAHDSHSSRRRT
ncbi:hypothetical protein EJ04DRAFT_28896 [Polyplosphaeria fusca]|uniref:CBF1-interacting co-repressor CIR N-terminal domain-containing protein n=1 Tax=Polyplosphaeria fusca TaxID=682080 RepID=A0A9P4UY02_9PLEO|nr:hypothetical protein EJ04DRAFT_28896 [Polyplosphaeria fusca]